MHACHRREGPTRAHSEPIPAAINGNESPQSRRDQAEISAHNEREFVILLGRRGHGGGRDPIDGWPLAPDRRLQNYRSTFLRHHLDPCVTPLWWQRAVLTCAHPLAALRRNQRSSADVLTCTHPHAHCRGCGPHLHTASSHRIFTPHLHKPLDQINGTHGHQVQSVILWWRAVRTFEKPIVDRDARRARVDNGHSAPVELHTLAVDDETTQPAGIVVHWCATPA